MINLTPESLNKYVSQLIDEEISNINSYINSQQKVNSKFLECFKNFSKNINTDLDSKEFMKLSQKLQSFVKIMEKNSMSSISSLTEIIDNLESMKSTLSINDNNSIDQIDQYNKSVQKIMNHIDTNNSEIEKFINENSGITEVKNELSKIIETKEIKPKKNAEEKKVTIELKEKVTKNNETKKNNKIIEINKITFIENTLIISETNGTVTLPYTIKELENIKNDNPDKYGSCKDVVKYLYTKPVSYYKHFSISRFREAYRLIKDKQSGSTGQALDLAIEVLYNSKLHPAVISACKNLTELEVYLFCLKYNQLDGFNFFKIVFDTPPSKNVSSIKEFLFKKEVGK